MLAFILGFFTGIICSLLVFLTFFVLGYNVIGTLLQLFQPETFMPSIRDLQKSKQIKTGRNGAIKAKQD